jgi:hypothetical protein
MPGLPFYRILFVVILIAGISSCTKDMLNDPTPDPPDDPDMGMGMDQDTMSMDTTTGPTVWMGPTVSFSKANGADPNDAANQDRLTDNVWITRGNNGGQIYNAVEESNYNKTNSPVGTEWAEGDIADWESLTYQKFRTAVVRPKNVVGKNLVMHLIEDDIYVQVSFTSWAQGQAGGFAYNRSSPE